MIPELRKALKKAEKLPKEKQKVIAEIILDEILKLGQAVPVD